MKARSIADIVKEVSETSNKKLKIDILRKYDHVGLRTFLDMYFASLEDRIEWLLPEGAPPYTPNPDRDADGALYGELRKFYIFAKGKSDHISQKKREILFIQLLETVRAEDAELILDMKDKKKIKGFDRKLYNEAYS